MKKIKLVIFSLIIVPLLCSVNSSAGLIDFETVPNGSPSDALAISTQYQSSHGVTFSWMGGATTTPYLEQTGSSDENMGFLNNAKNAGDVEADGFTGQLGNYFLRLGNAGLPGASDVGALKITYDIPVRGASAEIWDVDWANNQGTEQWEIKAFNNNNVEIGSQLTHMGDDMDFDGKPWIWSFDYTTNDIKYITISFTGSKTEGIGLAFDNFSTDSPAVPIPGAVWLLGSGLLGLLGIQRRRA